MAHFFLGPFFGPVWRDVSRTFPSRRGSPVFSRFHQSALGEIENPGRNVVTTERASWRKPFLTYYCGTPYLDSGRDGSHPETTGGPAKCLLVL